MKRRAFYWSILLVFILGLAACGTNDLTESIRPSSSEEPLSGATTLLPLVTPGVEKNTIETSSSSSTTTTPPPVESEGVRFAVLGDFGAGTPAQLGVANQLDLANQANPYQYLLLLGDNIYPDGNIGEFGQKYIEEPYGNLVNQGVEYVASLGNHDAYGGYQQDQIDYFSMPGHYYSKKIHNDLELFIIETNNFHETPEQQEWLKKALAESTTEWKIVMGHHSIYTTGDHAKDDQIRQIKEVLEPILIENKVDLFLGGHDHNYERFEPISGVTYVVSGGGGANLREFIIDSPYSAFRQKEHHFLLFDFADGALQFEAISKNGSVIDQSVIQKNL